MSTPHPSRAHELTAILL